MRAGALGGVHRGQAGERRTVLDAALVERLAQLRAVHPARVRRQQSGDVVRQAVGRRLRRRAGLRWPGACVPVVEVSTAKSTTPGVVTDAAAPTGVSSSSSSICSKRMSRTSDASPRTVRAAANAISQ